MRKIERLVNLIALLLSTRRPLTLDEITEIVPGYEAQGESLRRMFERDREELRALGVPVERAPVDAWGTEEGYFIDPKAYGMPQVELTGEERAALAVAARAWAGTGIDPAALAGLAKLELDPGAGPEAVGAALNPSPLVTALLEAVSGRKRITFRYQPPGRPAAERRLEPYGLLHRRGSWYVVGHDLDRGALRSFRISRICSEVRLLRPASRAPDFEPPEGFDPRTALPAGEPPGAPNALVRAASPAARLAELRGAEVVAGPDGDGRVTFKLPAGERDQLVAWAISSRAEILEPEDLRAEARRRLAGLLDALDRAPAPLPPEGEPRPPEALPAGTRARGTDPTAAARLRRLLAMVPWVLAHPEEATVEAVCARFGITRAQLMADLDLLFVSGVPPYGPGDLIEAWVDGDRVHIAFADVFARAPRLTWREAAGLYLAGRALARLPEVDPEGALSRALAKLETVLPADQLDRVQELASKVSVELDADPVEAERRAVLLRAAAASRRVVLEYYSSSRDEVTRRTVDPWVVFSASGHWYLSGWCHKARGERLFRLDRVLAVEETGERFERPAGFDPAAHARVRADPGSEGELCELELAPRVEWAAEWLPLRASWRLPDGRLRVRLAAHQRSWVIRQVLRLAPDALPVAPPELAGEVRTAARQALALYG